MILKIIGAVFGYLLCGVGVLKLIKLHDKHTDYMHQLLAFGDNELERVIVTGIFPIFFPIFLLYLIPWLIFKYVFVFINADYENHSKADIIVMLDKIKAEIESYKLSEDELFDMDEDSVKCGMKIAYDIVDKYKVERENEDGDDD